MENTRAVPLRLDLDGAPYGGAASSNPRASSSPGVQPASVAMTASPYPTPAPSTSSMQTIPPDALVQRESKRPRIISRHSGAISNTSTDLHSPAVHTSVEEAHDHLSINYPQASEMASQPSSAIGVVASSTMPSDTYPVVGTPYWSNTSIGVEAMGKSTSQGSDANNNRLVREDQMYGNSVAWGSQDVSMTMNRMHEYIPRRMTTSSWESEVPPHHHHHQQQQPQQPHQPMRSDGNLASPYESSSSAAGSTPQMYGDYLTVNAPPSAHRIVPSNAYPAPASVSTTTPGTPHQTPGTAAATWPRPPSLQSSGPGAGGGSLPRDIKPKILPSSQPTTARSSALQQQSSAANADGGDRAKGGGAGGGSGDRTTHNDVERKYRTNLKDRIAELRAAVPALQAQHDGESDGGGGGGGGASSGAPKVSKGTVLSKATEYIRQLEQANRAMMHEHRQLVERLHTLEAMLQNAGGGGVGGGRCPPPPCTANHGMAMFDPRGFS
ncbi:hypothetical protein MY4824_005666 [Beauveria thailandica]